MPCLPWHSSWPFRLSSEIPVILSQVFCLLMLFLYFPSLPLADSWVLFGGHCPVATFSVG